MFKRPPRRRSPEGTGCGDGHPPSVGQFNFMKHQADPGFLFPRVLFYMLDLSVITRSGGNKNSASTEKAPRKRRPNRVAGSHRFTRDFMIETYFHFGAGGKRLCDGCGGQNGRGEQNSNCELRSSNCELDPRQLAIRNSQFEFWNSHCFQRSPTRCGTSLLFSRHSYSMTRVSGGRRMTVRYTNGPVSTLGSSMVAS